MSLQQSNWSQTWQSTRNNNKNNQLHCIRLPGGASITDIHTYVDTATVMSRTYLHITVWLFCFVLFRILRCSIPFHCFIPLCLLDVHIIHPATHFSLNFIFFSFVFTSFIRHTWLLFDVTCEHTLYSLTPTTTVYKCTKPGKGDPNEVEKWIENEMVFSRVHTMNM